MHKIKLDNGKYKFIESYTGIDGKRHRVSVTKNNQTRATEKEAYKELQDKINEKLNVGLEEFPLSFFIKKFLEYKKSTVTKNTLASYKLCLTKIDDTIILKNVSKIYVENLLNKLKSEHSPSAIKLYKRVFVVLFNFIKDNYVPSFDIKIKLEFSKEEKVKEQSKIKFIETNIVENVLDSITHQTTKDFVTIQLHTGLRMGELLALTVDDVDFDNKIIHVTKTKHLDGGLGSPKTLSSIRKIAFSNKVKQILLNYVTSRKFLFNVSFTTIQMNLKHTGYSTHAFRHTHVALLIEAGVPIKVISERLGHSNTNTTLNIYTHVTENMILDLKSKLEELGTF